MPNGGRDHQSEFHCAASWKCSEVTHYQMPVSPLSYMCPGLISQGIILLPELQMEVHLIIMYLTIITTDTLTFHFGPEDWPSCTVYYLFNISALICMAKKKNSNSRFFLSLCTWQIMPYPLCLAVKGRYVDDSGFNQASYHYSHNNTRFQKKKRFRLVIVVRYGSKSSAINLGNMNHEV